MALTQGEREATGDCSGYDGAVVLVCEGDVVDDIEPRIAQRRGEFGRGVDHPRGGDERPYRLERHAQGLGHVGRRLLLLPADADKRAWLTLHAEQPLAEFGQTTENREAVPPQGRAGAKKYRESVRAGKQRISREQTA